MQNVSSSCWECHFTNLSQNQNQVPLIFLFFFCGIVFDSFFQRAGYEYSQGTKSVFVQEMRVFAEEDQQLFVSLHKLLYNQCFHPYKANLCSNYRHVWFDSVPDICRKNFVS